ncbi:amidohydrolase family protein [Actinospica sp. MGRD01-02]|uniref:Amidohydrolase family protein n=1 Tax=Actinospica acidithermotolerans TaxID=2828514 RepID=A0A941E4T6_9ACTN|nr:amidohydrolase family protein [Actinospica acidithermotolerans]MBR7825136.1 amidohydrolase family protein [Actinospica acidithermotolerans]
MRRTAAAATGRLALITDAMAATGSPDGEYLLGSLKVKVTAGRAELSDGSSLAGSTLTMDRALRTAVQCGVPFLDALAAVTSTPARALGLDGSCGQIAIGRAADLVHLDDDLTVRAVMRRGRWVPATAARSARMPPHAK